MANAMTQREFLNAVVEGNITDEIKTYALEAIEKMNKRNTDRKTKPSKVQIANATLRASIVAKMREAEDGTVFVASEIAKMFDFSTQKASALLLQIVDSGEVEQTEVKVKGKGAVKGYRLVNGKDE